MNKKKKKALLQFLADKFAWLLILLWEKMARVEVVNRHYLHQAYSTGQGVILAAWHGRMLVPILAHRRQNVAAMVSRHNDGEMIARTIIRLGYETVRGSSSHGGREAFRDMLKLLKAGRTCAILPDGPRGPRCEMKIGTILLAQRGNAVLLPLVFSAQKPIVFKSWDQFTLWKPFSRIRLVYGEPRRVPRKISAKELETVRESFEKQMNELQDSADAIFRT